MLIFEKGVLKRVIRHKAEVAGYPTATWKVNL